MALLKQEVIDIMRARGQHSSACDIGPRHSNAPIQAKRPFQICLRTLLLVESVKLLLGNRGSETLFIVRELNCVIFALVAEYFVI